jgi:hypothetical protein
MATDQVPLFMIELWVSWYWLDVTKNVITLSACGTSLCDGERGSAS